METIDDAEQDALDNGLTFAYIKRKTSKPKKRHEQAQLKEWLIRGQEATVKFVMSTVFHCQAVEVITTTKETETAEGNRLLTWLYWKNAVKEQHRKTKLKKKEKDSKEPANDNEEDLPDDED